jgi:dihydroflavonol-4-reductase
MGWPRTTGGVCLVDVRDVAAVLAATVQPGRGPRRLVLGGPFFTWAELGALCDEITGVRATRLPLPKPVLFAAASLLDQIRRFRSLSYPLTRDAAEMMTTMVPTDDRPTLEELGVTLRPIRESLEDTFRWLAESGHLPAANAGRLAP